MATSITTIQSTDLITNSRADINNNFDSLLVNKIETDVITTDSTFAAASDSKLPSQLAVKQYVDAGGNPDIAAAQAGGGDFGTPSATNKFVTEEKIEYVRSERIVYEFADSPATWTKDAGLKRIRVQAWGGGGGGGGTTADNAGGGGGGGYVEWSFEASELGATETVTIAAGGAGGNAGAGSVGGNTTFGSLLTAYGGGGGGADNSAVSGGNGGNAFAANAGYAGAGAGTYVVGDSAVKHGFDTGGGAGGWANDFDAQQIAGGDSIYGGGGGGGTYSASRAGGTSKFGGNGGASLAVSAGTATAGSVPGGGGGGSQYGSGTPIGGAGGAGRCIVTEYYV